MIASMDTPNISFPFFQRNNQSNKKIIAKASRGRPTEKIR